ncbi:hypothetical protein NP233_g11700 [Leucocoprinus birnbaumii]|uniref:ribonuclease H n=1 Tax=Leucocoprinus birnbaumii TaxID=56174 RepID=A0AAD5VLP7_9AGAR|nr:hypothetical protein NP233_g11700 [Leucocoprinus birnbaumii]
METPLGIGHSIAKRIQSSQYNETPSRLYTPVPNCAGETSADVLVRHCKECKLCSVYDNLVVFVDGACPGNGTADARAGLGVFFHSDSPLNFSAPLPEGPHTNQRAEICAAIIALEIVKEFFDSGCHRGPWGNDFTGVIVISDSAYLVNAMTDWISKWLKNGWRNADGKRVVHKEDILELEELVEYLEGNRFSVKFWHVERSQNAYADALAKQAVAI